MLLSDPAIADFAFIITVAHLCIQWTFFIEFCGKLISANSVEML